MYRLAGPAVGFACLFAAAPAHAAQALDGARLSGLWAVPFAGVLASIAVGPLVIPQIWHRRYGVLSGLWGVLVVVALSIVLGPATAMPAVLGVLLHDYLPFILMLFALYTAAGGIVVGGRLHGSPLQNTGLLALATGLASLIGATGASMIFVRPLLRANEGRRFTAHIFVFMIFLGGNIGGALTPLGNPPLFLGLLHGVDFFWTTEHLWRQTLLASAVLLIAFFAIDSWLARREPPPGRTRLAKDVPLGVRGSVNIILIAVAIGAIILSAVWRPGMAIDLAGARWEVQNLVREWAMLAVGVASILLTPRGNRVANGFSWEPIVEVAKLFAAIFVCLIPVMAMLQAGREGAFAPLVDFAAHPAGVPSGVAYFWSTGLLSSLLDNAPTYLVFFELAGGDPQALMGPMHQTLEAISLGAVFMGAMTYIGNAPNFMIYSIVRRAGIGMPSFFGYLAWSGLVLTPLFVLISLLFFT
ncbi:MAG: sodium:proton antiporter [Methylobacteriaceae bacterium]|nr:sodium:proton antiporter [Methylobacteriaceae bacterium]